MHRVPRDVRARYRKALAEGNVVIVAAATGQPADTLAALLGQAGGALVDQWWQQPADLFAPPELAGPFRPCPPFVRVFGTLPALSPVPSARNDPVARLPF